MKEKLLDKIFKGITDLRKPAMPFCICKIYQFCGRSARPFPYASFVLSDCENGNSSEFSEEANMSIWNDIMTFEIMDEKNKKIYEKYSKDILEDFEILDRDLVENAIKIMKKI